MELATNYQQNSKLQLNDDIFLINMFYKRFGKTTKALDIGCGNGSFVTRVFKKYLSEDVEIDCCDTCEEMVNFANTTYGNDRTRFRKLSIEDRMPEEWMGKFNIVSSFYMLHWVGNRRTAMQNVFDVMESNGIFIFVYPIYSPFMDCFKTMSKSSEWSQNLTNFVVDFESKDAAGDLRRLLKTIGFADIQVERRERSYFYNSLEEVEGFISAIRPFMIHLPEERTEAFIEEWRRNVMKYDDITMIDNNDTVGVWKKYDIIVGFCRKP